MNSGNTTNWNGFIAVSATLGILAVAACGAWLTGHPNSSSPTPRDLSRGFATPSPDPVGLPSDSNWLLSIQHVIPLPPDAKMSDVCKLLDGYPFSDVPMFVVYAHDGGIYIFNFLGTPEIPMRKDQNLSDLSLVAVIYSPPGEGMWSAQASYVYPPLMRGRKVNRNWFGDVED